MRAKPKHYRQLAEQSRKLAKGITDAEAKAHLLEVATQYEKLAEQAALEG